MDAIQPDTKSLQRYLHFAVLKGSIPILDLVVKRYGGIIKTNPIHNDHSSFLSHQRYQQQQQHPSTNEEGIIMTTACNENQIEMVKHLIQRYGCDPHASNDIYLRKACLNGFEELVRILLPGANIHFLNDAALQNAVHKRNATIVELLLSAGANPMANRYSCLFHAIKNNDAYILFHLLKFGADPHYQQNQLFIFACHEGHKDILCLLIKFIFMNSPSTLSSSSSSPSPLSYLAWMNLSLDDLLQKNQQVYLPIMINLIDCQNGTPLFEALSMGHSTVVEFLLHYGANPNALNAIQGLDHAILNNHLTCVELMARKNVQSSHSLSHYMIKHTVKRPMKQLLQSLHNTS
ncbi:unnamed protein product [Cunninghamella blakesleeana]